MPVKNDSGFIGLILILPIFLVTTLLIGGAAFYLVKSQPSKTTISQSTKPVTSTTPQIPASTVRPVPKEKMLFVNFVKATSDELIPGKAIFFTYDPSTKEKKDLFDFESSSLELFEAGISPDKSKIYWVSHLWPVMGSSFNTTAGAYSPKLYIFDQSQKVREIKVSDDPSWELDISTVGFNEDREFHPCHFFSDNKRMACLLTNKTGKAKVITIDTRTDQIQTISELGNACQQTPNVSITTEDFGTGNLDSIKNINTPDQPCYPSSGEVWIYLEGWSDDNKLILKNYPGSGFVFYSLDPETYKIELVNKTALQNNNRFLRPVIADITLNGKDYHIQETESDLTFATDVTNAAQATTNLKGVFVGIVNF